MLKAFVIKPSEKRGKISCSSCELSYKNKDYKILFDNKKIIYFLLDDNKNNKKEINCHECLSNRQPKDKDGKIKIYDENGKVYKYYLK